MTTLPPFKSRPRPVVLAILDGWGCRADGDDNAIAKASTPNWDYLSTHFPFGRLSASAKDVGLPDGQMGNSEVGHMNIGAGRVVLQDLPRIDEAAGNGTMAQNPQLLRFINTLRSSGGACHLMGLLSPGGIHSHQHHIAALATILAQAGITVYLHAFLDGRDTPPKSALSYVGEMEAVVQHHNTLHWGTVSGRYYAMDRDKRWDRVEKAYRALVLAEGERATTAEAAIEQSYANDKTDEFVLPTALGDYTGMQAGDGLIMANFRADRARELLTALLDERFDGFDNSTRPSFAAQLGMVEYSSALATLIPALFPPEPITETLGEVVSNAGLRQLRIAETEKYAHVTFFLNAGREEEFAGEERILIPSPKVATYDLQPEMSAPEVTDALVEAIESQRFDLMVVNYANPDMVGHTGDMNAAIQAVECVDTCLGRLSSALLPTNGMLCITADHGNIEQMEDHSTQQAHTAHTVNPVPFVMAYQPWEGQNTPLPDGRLCDIAPTLLHALNVAKPAAMKGISRLHALMPERDNA